MPTLWSHHTQSWRIHPVSSSYLTHSSSCCTHSSYVHPVSSSYHTQGLSYHTQSWRIHPGLIISHTARHVAHTAHMSILGAHHIATQSSCVHPLLHHTLACPMQFLTMILSRLFLLCICLLSSQPVRVNLISTTYTWHMHLFPGHNRRTPSRETSMYRYRHTWCIHTPFIGKVIHGVYILHV